MSSTLAVFYSRYIYIIAEMTDICNHYKIGGKMEKWVPPVSVVRSSTIKHKPIFINKGNEIDYNSFSSLIHFTYHQPPESGKTKQHHFCHREQLHKQQANNQERKKKVQT